MSTHCTAPQALIRRTVTAVLLACWTAGCGGWTPDGAVTASWLVDPASSASHQQTRLRLTLRDAEGLPVRGARLRIEAHMSHPGMAPVLAEARERPDGVYEASLELTMAGAWTLVASGALADGRVITRTLDGVAVP